MFKMESNAIDGRLISKTKPNGQDTSTKHLSPDVTRSKHAAMSTGCQPQECTVFGKRFKTKGELISHMRTHTGEKPYACVICGKEFRFKPNLTTHN